MIKADSERLKKIYLNATSLQQYIKDNKIDKNAILSELPLQWLVTTPLYNIGEHVYNLSEEFKRDHEDIPWNMISGLRHRLVHDYEGTNWSIVVEVIYNELPEFIKKIKDLI